jgi:hypothetical protein
MPRMHEGADKCTNERNFTTVGHIRGPHGFFESCEEIALREGKSLMGYERMRRGLSRTEGTVGTGGTVMFNPVRTGLGLVGVVGLPGFRPGLLILIPFGDGNWHESPP